MSTQLHALAAVVVTGLLAAAAPARATPTIELFTIGPGADVFSHFGHTALCVLDEGSPDGRCYNFGTADVSDPLDLAWETASGRGRFWVGEVPRLRLLEAYQLEDRTIWRQRIPLDAEQATRLAAELSQLGKEAAAYRYHPLDDNCTTRVRDLLDAASGGELRDGGERLDGMTLRQHGEAGLAGRPLLLAMTLLVLGPAGERPTTLWEAMALPLGLRDRVAERLGAQAAVLYQRRTPEFPASTAVGGGLLVGLGLFLAAGLGVLGRKPGPTRRGAIAAVGLVLGGIGAALWLLVFTASFPEIRANAAVLILVPLDLAVPFLPLRWLALWARLRLGGLALVLLASMVGVVLQPVVALVALVAFPAAAIWLLAARRASEAAPAPAAP